MVTDEPRFPVKVTVRAARADGSVEAARRREAVAEGMFTVMCGDAAQAATQHSINADDVKFTFNSGDAAIRGVGGCGKGALVVAENAKRGFRFRKPREERD
jgi:hypothetical protein